MGPAYLVILIVCAAFAGRLVRLPYSGALGDLFWQQQLGAYVLQHHRLPTSLGSETFTAAGMPWIPQEWLIGIAVDWAMTHAMLWVLAVAAVAALAGALLLTARRAQRYGASATGTAICILLALLAVEGSFGIRAQAFAWLFFAALLFVLDLEGPIVFVALPIVAAWANVHASVMLAIPIVWIDAAFAVARRGFRDPEASRRLALAVTVPLATLATPLGVDLPRYAVMLIQSPIRHSIEEWQPISSRATFFWYGAFPLVLLALSGARTLLARCPRDVAWIVLLLAMTIGAARDAALLGLAAAPAAAVAYTVLLSRLNLRQSVTSPGPRRFAIVGAMALAVAAFIFNVRAPTQANDPVPPRATFDRIAETPGTHRVFCYDFAICSVGLAYSNVRVFMDGRADPYPVPVWNDFNLVRFARPGWLERLDAYGVDAVVVKPGDSLDRVLRGRRDWTAQPRLDPCCRTYLRTRRPSK